MIGAAIGLFYANAVEWVVHKYLLHGLGKRKGSWWSFHWAEHHKNSRQSAMYDPDYEKPWTDWNAHGKEAAGIGMLMALHAPLFPVAPYFTAAVWYSGINYLRMHKKSHLNPEWAKLHMRSHYDHHMGRNQDSNWCVTRPWFDWVMGTREHFEYKTKARARQSAIFPTPRATEASLPEVSVAFLTSDEAELQSA